MDTLLTIGGWIVGPVVVLVGILAAFWGYGVKQRSVGRKQEADRAAAKRAVAAGRAAEVQAQTAKKTGKRLQQETEQWEE